MRPFHAAVAALSLLVMATAIVAGGRVLKSGGNAESRNRSEDARASPGEPVTAAISKTPAPKAQAPKPVARSRATDPEDLAPPSLAPGQLERIEPRKPLSDLALAKPPKTRMPDDWKGTSLFQAVAPAAGLIEAKGYSVTISGIDPVGRDETCAADGKSWSCGVRARTAFRAFLRGRAVVCAVPPEGGHDLIAAQCRIGKQDVGEWLVENGWARAAAGGPYGEAGDKARTAKKGIFGRAPDLSGLPPAPARITTEIEPSGSILDLSGQPPAPPVDQPATPQVFPPAPAQ